MQPEYPITEEEQEEVEDIEISQKQDKMKKKTKIGGKVERAKKIVKNDYAAVKRWREKNPEKVIEYQKKHWKPKYNLSRKRFKTCSNDNYMKPEPPCPPSPNIPTKSKKQDKQ